VRRCIAVECVRDWRDDRRGTSDALTLRERRASSGRRLAVCTAAPWRGRIADRRRNDRRSTQSPRTCTTMSSHASTTDRRVRPTSVTPPIQRASDSAGCVLHIDRNTTASKPHSFFSRPYSVVRSRLWYDVLSVCRLSVTFCIVAKRYAVEGRRWYLWIWRW